MIESMMHEVEKIEVTTTESVLEAIILEAVLIKRHQPKYNVLGKDDKSWNYLVVTRDVFPRITSLRQHDLEQLLPGEIETRYLELFGPFPGLNAKATLKIIRRLFFVSTCEPSAEKRPCLYRQMRQCLGVCTGDITAASYRTRVIRPLLLFLRGEKKRVLTGLKKSMVTAAKAENFEEAARLRNQVFALERIQDSVLINESFVRHERARPEVGDLIGDQTAFRVEGYDISNLGATGKVASMVVFDEHGPVKSQYRKFTIKTVVGQSDVDCLKEVLNRRLNHPEWPLPTLFLIDGGRPQVNAVLSVVRARGVKIPVVGIAKGAERKRNDIILGEPSIEIARLAQAYRSLLIRVRDEAHRFAITFQRSKRRIKR
jgi:excinuclease ABC subunit C